MAPSRVRDLQRQLLQGSDLVVCRPLFCTKAFPSHTFVADSVLPDFKHCQALRVYCTCLAVPGSAVACFPSLCIVALSASAPLHHHGMQGARWYYQWGHDHASHLPTNMPTSCSAASTNRWVVAASGE